MNIAKKRLEHTGVITRRGKVLVRGMRVDRLWERTMFKLPNRLSRAFSYSKNSPQRRGILDYCSRLVEFNQELFGREHVSLVVLGETGGWHPIPEGTGMFGSAPLDMGIVNVPLLQALAVREKRVQPKYLTMLHLNIVRWLMRESHRTGFVLHYVVDATLKHTPGMTTDVIDHYIRQTARHMRRLQKRFPKAAVILRVRNEWDAHNLTRTSLDELNWWGKRMHRWKAKPKREKVSFVSPGPSWIPEQWPEVTVVVDHGGRNDFTYSCGQGPGRYQMGLIHPTRSRGWEKLPTKIVGKLRRLANGQPVGFSESMYYVEREHRERAKKWYRGPDGWTTDLKKYITFLDNMEKAGVNLFCIHDEEGLQGDLDRKATRLEHHIAERLGGRVMI